MHKIISRHLTRYSVLTLITLNASNHNGTMLGDHFMGPQSIPRVFYSTNLFLIEILLLFTTFKQFTTRGQDVYAHTSRRT